MRPREAPLGFTDAWLRLGVVTPERIQDLEAELRRGDGPDPGPARVSAFAEYLERERPLSPEMAEGLFRLGEADPDPSASAAMLRALVDLPECPEAVLGRALGSGRPHLVEAAKRRRENPPKSLERESDFTEAVARIAAALGRPARLVDDAGYDLEITAAAIEDSGAYLAWVECRSRWVGQFLDIAYHLRVRRELEPVLDWEVRTYNPFFGCEVEWMAWWGDRLALLYREKHHPYAVSWAPGQDVARRRVTDQWLVHGDHLIYRSETVDRVERLRLPGLEPLEPWPADEARRRGLLPEDYDVMNEIVRQYGPRRR